MDTLDGLKTIVAVVETGSFTNAAERLGWSKALVSKYVGEVEKGLGTRLFNRSTRKQSLTEAGQRYYQRALPLLEEFSELEDSVTGESTRPQGQIRISTPVTFGEMILAPRLPAFQQEYPEVSVDLQLTDRKIDMLEEGIDLVIRIGGVDDSRLIARQITSVPLYLCASPDYLKQNGEPQTPDDIAEHHCIIDSNFRIGKQWPLLSPDGQSYSIEVSSKVAVNSPRAVKSIAVAGGGIGLIPNFIVTEELKNGSLQQLLPSYTTLEFGMFAIYPHRRYLSKKVRCFIDFVQREFVEGLA